MIEPDEMEREYPTDDEGGRKLEELAAKIKHDQRKKEFDIVSGDCDSSHICHIAKEKLGVIPMTSF